MTAGQARLLHRFGERVVVNFDQDEAGRKATLKSLEILTEEGLDVRVVDLPDGHDPDTFLRESGTDAYRKRLDEAPVSMEWLITRAAAQNDTRTPQGKAAYLKELLPSLVRIKVCGNRFGSNRISSGSRTRTGMRRSSSRRSVGTSPSHDAASC